VRAAEIDAVTAALGRDVTGVRTLTGGFSHETCLLELGAERLVVRLGGTDPGIEAAVMTAARRHVPVPAVLHVLPAAENQPARPAMVLEFVAGTPLGEVLSGEDSADKKSMAELGAEVGRVFGRIGRVTFGRPGFFTGADLAVGDMDPWSEQLPEMTAAWMAATPDSRLDMQSRRAWIRLCETHAPALQRIDGQARLVHADANPKNVLVSHRSDNSKTGWRVDAVLDWEFSFSGCPYADAANMTRFAGDYPPGFAGGFRDGFAAALPENGDGNDGAGGDVRDDGVTDWVYLGHVMDMFALGDLVTRPAGHPVADRAAAEIRRWIADGVPGAPPTRTQPPRIRR
jgi:aminoglycoside phosphotransferase (APT) family kinase protein